MTSPARAPDLETARLTGRPFRAEDADLAAEIWGAPETAAWLTPSGLPYEPETIAAKTRRLADHWAEHGFGLLRPVRPRDRRFHRLDRAL